MKLTLIETLYCKELARSLVVLERILDFHFDQNLFDPLTPGLH